MKSIREHDPGFSLAPRRHRRFHCRPRLTSPPRPPQRDLQKRDTTSALHPADLAAQAFSAILLPMSTVQEIEAAIPRLTRAEVESLRQWIEDYLEAQLELTDDTKARLDQSRREIEAGQFTTRRPEK